MTQLGRAARLTLVALVGAGITGLLASGAVSCQFAWMTGAPCPGCGLTRATLSIVRGDLAAAYALQPFAFVVTPLVAVSGAFLARAFVTGSSSTGAARVPSWIGPAFALLAVSMVAFWVARLFGFWGGPTPV